MFLLYVVTLYVLKSISVSCKESVVINQHQTDPTTLSARPPTPYLIKLHMVASEMKCTDEKLTNLPTIHSFYRLCEKNTQK